MAWNAQVDENNERVTLTNDLDNPENAVSLPLDVFTVFTIGIDEYTALQVAEAARTGKPAEFHHKNGWVSNKELQGLLGYSELRSKSSVCGHIERFCADFQKQFNRAGIALLQGHKPNGTARYFSALPNGTVPLKLDLESSRKSKAEQKLLKEQTKLDKANSKRELKLQEEFDKL